MKWFKLHNDIIHDPKIRALAYEDRWHFVALMCLMNDGTLDEPDGIRDELVEVSLGLHGVDLANLKKRLIRLRLIGDDWRPVNWEKRQESKDKTAAMRMRKYRESLKESKVTPDVTRNVTRTLRTEVEVEEEEEDIGAKAPRRRFAPPTLEDVTDYCRERGNGINPQHFLDHYEANGWIRGKTKIKDWKACVRTWEKNQPQGQPNEHYF